MSQIGLEGQLGWLAGRGPTADRRGEGRAARNAHLVLYYLVQVVAMLSLFLAQQGLGLEAGGRRCPEQLISLRPGGSVVCRAVSSVEVSQNMTSAPASEEFIRPHLRKLAAYTPIEPFEVLSRRLGRDALDIVKLDANENPYGPPPEVLEALGSMPFPNIYPDPETRRLRSALAEANNIPAENLLV